MRHLSPLHENGEFSGYKELEKRRCLMSMRLLQLTTLLLFGLLGMSGTAHAEPSPSSELERINVLSQGAVEGIDTALENYGGMTGFGGDYSTASRGILQSLLAEWEIHEQIGRFAQTSSDERLKSIMALLNEAEAVNTRFVKRTNTELTAIAHSENALRFRKRQISLYEDLQQGLLKDKAVLAQIQQMSKP